MFFFVLAYSVIVFLHVYYLILIENVLISADDGDCYPGSVFTVHGVPAERL